MQYPDSIYTCDMTNRQRAMFYTEYERARKDEVICVLFAIFLGWFGAHHFYLRRNGLGILYLLFFWTGIPAFLGLIDAFLSPGRVRSYNAECALDISRHILVGATLSATRSCPSCSNIVESGAAFCPRCGAATQPLNPQPAV